MCVGCGGGWGGGGGEERGMPETSVNYVTSRVPIRNLTMNYIIGFIIN